MLEVADLHAFYGKSHVLHGVHLAVRPGEIVSLLGRNGVHLSPRLRVNPTIRGTSPTAP